VGEFGLPIFALPKRKRVTGFGVGEVVKFFADTENKCRINK
jgi:hypothetical protein